MISPSPFGERFPAIFCFPKRSHDCVGQSEGHPIISDQHLIRSGNSPSPYHHKYFTVTISYQNSHQWYSHNIYIYRYIPYQSPSLNTGWWFGTFYIFPLILGCCPHPNWRTHIFQDGVALAHQPEYFITIFFTGLFWASTSTSDVPSMPEGPGVGLGLLGLLGSARSVLGIAVGVVLAGKFLKRT